MIKLTWKRQIMPGKYALYILKFLSKGYLKVGEVWQGLVSEELQSGRLYVAPFPEKKSESEISTPRKWKWEQKYLSEREKTSIIWFLSYFIDSV